jgi:hypothetical protein
VQLDFASELDALLAGMDRLPELDPASVEAFFVLSGGLDSTLLAALRGPGFPRNDQDLHSLLRCSGPRARPRMRASPHRRSETNITSWSLRGMSCLGGSRRSCPAWTNLWQPRACPVTRHRGARQS